MALGVKDSCTDLHELDSASKFAWDLPSTALSYCEYYEWHMTGRGVKDISEQVERCWASKVAASELVLFDSCIPPLRSYMRFA